MELGQTYLAQSGCPLVLASKYLPTAPAVPTLPLALQYFFTAQCCVFFIFSKGKGVLWSPSNRLLIQQLAAGICGRKETPYPSLPYLPRLPLFSAHSSRLLLPCTDMFPQAVEHLAAAISVYPDQASLLQLLQSNLPPQAFEMLVRKLQSAAQEQADQITEQD